MSPEEMEQRFTVIEQALRDTQSEAIALRMALYATFTAMRLEGLAPAETLREAALEQIELALLAENEPEEVMHLKRLAREALDMIVKPTDPDDADA